MFSDYKKSVEKRIRNTLQCYPTPERDTVVELIGRRFLGLDNRLYPEFTDTELESISYDGIKREGDFPKRIWLDEGVRGELKLSSWLFYMILDKEGREEFRKKNDEERMRMKKTVAYKPSLMVALPPVTYLFEASWDKDLVYSTKMHLEDFKMLHGDVDQFKDGKVLGVKTGEKDNKQFVSLPFTLTVSPKEEKEKEKPSHRESIPQPPPPLK